MIRLASIAAFMALSTASFGATYSGGGTYIANNGKTGTWTQTVEVTGSEGRYHINKDNQFMMDGQAINSKLSYDLIGNRGSMPIRTDGQDVGTASCHQDTCSYSIGAEGFELDTGLAMGTDTFKKIGTIKFNYNGQEVTVHYEGTISAM
jgi:hypothetical protein